MAYGGDKGLEDLDSRDGRIYRYARLSASGPIAWDEAGGWIYYSAEGGIYRVALRGG